jgi:2-oxoisovalerate dehydrogenase E1 component
MATTTAIKPIAASDASFAREMLARMAFIRAFEAQALAFSTSNPPIAIGSVHLCAGQEAVPLGAMAALNEDDQVIATYRGHGWALACGLDPTAVMAEICHRRTGINGGRAGSAYLMDPGNRFIGENSIVGAGVTIGCGVAMANQLAGDRRVVIVSIGDGAMNQGSVHEGLAFAAARRLPLILVCENNGWSELTPTEAMFRVDRIAKRAAGYGIAGVTISGADPVAVRDTVAAAAERVRAGEGPILIECRVPRLWGHYNRDMEHYRPKADRAEAEANDPIGLLEARLIAAAMIDPDQAAALRREQEDRVAAIAADVAAALAPDAGTARLHVVAKPDPGALATGSTPTELSYIEAVNAALRAELESDARTVVYGEDVGHSGGIFAASRRLQKDFGAERVFDTPIAENAILGSAVGAALCGLKPIVEIMWADFLFVAFDQLINQAANVRYVTQGRSSVPMVVRLQQGVTPGSCAQHSQSIEAFLAHVPGLKVALAATPQDAYALLRAAAADPDPCIVIEARGLYQTRGAVHLDAPTEPAGIARLHRSGADVAIVTWGTMVRQANAAADVLAEEGVDASVLDLRWLAPLDETMLRDVVQRCGGRVLIVHEAVRTGGFGAEIATRIGELSDPATPLTVRRLTTPDVRIPASPILQQTLIPGVDAIAAAARDLAAINS